MRSKSNNRDVGLHSSAPLRTAYTFKDPNTQKMKLSWTSASERPSSSAQAKELKTPVMPLKGLTEDNVAPECAETILQFRQHNFLLETFIMYTRHLV